MSDAVTPERYEECRALFRPGSLDERRRRSCSAWGDLDAAGGDLLAEVDRLRALPVLQRCGDCRHHEPITTSDPADYAWCGHADAPGTEAYDAKTKTDAAPPSWCPMRGVP